MSTGDVVATLTLILALFTLGRLYRSGRDHLEAHLEAVRYWASGPKGEGWSDSDIDVETMLMWHDPSFSAAGLPVGSGISQLTALENMFLTRELRHALVSLGVAVEIFNSHLEGIRAFDSGSVATMLNVSKKLNSVYTASDDGKGVRLKIDLGGAVSVNRVFEAACLSEPEVVWSKFRFELLRTAHCVQIGNATVPGVYSHLKRLEEVMRREGFRLRANVRGSGM